MAELYTQYYIHQSGGGVTYSDTFLKFKTPLIYQRGRGVGSIFSTIWRFLQPILKKGAEYASKELLETGSDIISGIADQKPIKDILVNRSLQTIDKIRDKASSKLKSMAGSGRKKRKCNTKTKKNNVKKIKREVKRNINHSVGSLRAVKKKNVSKKKQTKPRILDIFS